MFSPRSGGSDGRRVIPVSELNREARFLLCDHFGSIWVEGEIFNLAIPSSGHLYFTLKDAEAQVRCAMFKPHARSLGFVPENGRQVVVQATVGLYEPRGEFQLVVVAMEESGDGALLRAFEQLKRKLAAEGLFAAERKRKPPRLPQCIGVITSPTGAAIRDVLSILRRRFPAIPVVLFPVSVQGTRAPQEVSAALSLAQRSGLCDVLILARGGGSAEDLWAFNEESVARAIEACSIPVITGIGHEVDFTIADFVADLRAPTPSAAAEAASPDQAEWLDRFAQINDRLIGLTRRRMAHTFAWLGQLAKRTANMHPRRRLITQMQRIDEMELRLRRAWNASMWTRSARSTAVSTWLLENRPDRLPVPLLLRRHEADRKLRQQLRQRLASAGTLIGHLGCRLDTVSPLATLARGYSVTQVAGSRVIAGIALLAPGTRVETRLVDGRFVALVEEVDPDSVSDESLS